MTFLSNKHITWFAVTIMVASAAFAFGQDVKLPDGEGKAILETKCTVCHDLTLVADQHLTKNEWTDKIKIMVASGADVSDQEMGVLADYLAKNFGPGDQGGAPAAGQLPEGEAKKILETKCTVCHDLMEVTRQHLTRAEWTDMIGVMVASGAEVTEQETATLVDYLTKNFGPEK